MGQETVEQAALDLGSALQAVEREAQGTRDASKRTDGTGTEATVVQRIAARRQRHIASNRLLEGLGKGGDAFSAVLDAVLGRVSAKSRASAGLLRAGNKAAASAVAGMMGEDALAGARGLRLGSVEAMAGQLALRERLLRSRLGEETAAGTGTGTGAGGVSQGAGSLSTGTGSGASILE